jgi:hypothetical protein
VHSCGHRTGAPAKRPARCSDRPRQHIPPRRSRSVRSYGSVVVRPAARRRNQNRTAIPAVPIEAPTSIPTLRYWETTASKAGHTRRQRAHPEQQDQPQQSGVEPDVSRHGRSARSAPPRGSRGHDVSQGLLRLLAAARARTRTAFAFVPPQDTPRPFTDRSPDSRHARHASMTPTPD